MSSMQLLKDVTDYISLIKLSDNYFSYLKKFVREMCRFGSTYLCEQSFSTMKLNKSKYRCCMTDVNLKLVMIIAISYPAPNFNAIV